MQTLQMLLCLYFSRTKHSRFSLYKKPVNSDDPLIFVLIVYVLTAG